MRLALPCLLLLIVAACGGDSSDPGITELTSPAVLAAIPAMTKGLGRYEVVLDAPRAGYRQMLMDENTWQGFYAFSLDGLPDGAVVTEATLRFRQTGTIGTPFQSLDDFAIQHVDLGTFLDPAVHYKGPTLDTGQKLEGDASTVARTHEVTSWVQDDLDQGRPTAGFRFEFQVPAVPPMGTHFVDLDDATDSDYAGPATLEVHWSTP